ncbi:MULTISPECIES: phosphate acetyltransferase [unclassified Bifidobacterium]|uniref:phosphate acetyltransferase n=1 Tax=unclassified Bifidobacterium TaxID=2608897 RepID=UPI003F935AEA
MSERVIYIASPEGGNGRNVVAYGVLDALTTVARTGVFRPIACRKSPITQSLVEASNAGQGLDDVHGVCPKYAREHPQCVRPDIVSAYYDTVKASGAEAMVIVGTDASHVFNPHSFELDVDIAADLKSPVFLAVCTMRRNGEEVLATVESCRQAIEHGGSAVVGVFVTGCTPEKAADARQALSGLDIPVWTIPAVDFPDPEHDDAAERALKAFRDNAPANEVRVAIDTPFCPATTPYAFQNKLLHGAKESGATIVLPEGEEGRILEAADYLLEREVVDLLILGERDGILKHGDELGLKHLSEARFQSMNDETVLAPMIDKLCELRAKKGMTPDKAREQLKDPSYFGTMLVVLGKADGLVSGSVNSTANTVRPALQVIKTKPGNSLVSGAFLMCFKTHVAVFADVAITPNPDARQLAEIAIESARTAKSLGIDPRVGMLSYSTLGSGKGPDVDLVEEATALAHEQQPDLPLVGPIQFDAAWEPEVAATKAPGNPVAGHVNVFVFPDLSAGNIGYKAVQRASGARAIGPVLQGLNRPVNDLSRGATVQDIINTIALTALQTKED